jgi:hypothetical protein
MQATALDIVNPRLQRLCAYWSEKRGGRAMPSRDDIDPVELAFIIGNLILVDVLDGDPPDFRIRLHGTVLSQRVGYELTGKMLADMPAPEFRARSRRSFLRVARTAQPLHARRDRVMDGRVHRYEALILPLSRDGARVDMILCGLIYDDAGRSG